MCCSRQAPQGDVGSCGISMLFAYEGVKFMQEQTISPRSSAPVKTQLADGTIVYIQAHSFGGEQKVSGKLPSFEEVTHAISGIAKPLVKMLEDIQPRKATLEFGVEV